MVVLILSRWLGGGEQRVERRAAEDGDLEDILEESFLAEPAACTRYGPTPLASSEGTTHKDVLVLILRCRVLISSTSPA